MKQVPFFVDTPTQFVVCVDDNAEDRLSKSILNKEEGVFSEAKFLYSISPAGAALLDIGANVGLFSLFFAANHRPVWAIEAAPTNVALLRESSAINGFQNLHVHNVAVSDREGELEFVEDGPFGSVNNAVMLKASRQVITTVPSVAIDGWSEAESMPNNLIVKIDIEGHEVHAIRGMHKFLKARDLPRLFIESNSYCLGFFSHSPVDLARELETIGYSIYRYESENTMRPWSSEEFQAILVQNLIAIGPNDDFENLPPIIEPRSRSQRLAEIQKVAGLPRPYHRAVLGRTMQYFPRLLEEQEVLTVLKRLSKDGDQDVRESVSWFDFPTSAADQIESESKSSQRPEASAGTKKNLVFNSSFEENISGWTAYHAFLALSSGDSISGNASLEITTGDNLFAGALYAMANVHRPERKTIPCKPKTRYSLSAWIKGVANYEGLSINMIPVGDDPEHLGGKKVRLTDAWQLVEYGFETESNTKSLGIRFQKANDNRSDATIRIDEVELIETPR